MSVPLQRIDCLDLVLDTPKGKTLMIPARTGEVIYIRAKWHVHHRAGGLHDSKDWGRDGN